MRATLPRRLIAETLGTAMLLATVVGSGIMAQRLADGNRAIALLGNTIPTGAILFVLIVMFAPISGAHFNPAVTLAMIARKRLGGHDAALYLAAQIAGGICGVLVAHMMFAEAVFQFGATTRTGAGQWLAEAIATFGLVLVVFLAERHRLQTVAAAVGLYITAAYWFTASTSFANPAVTIARGLSDSFAGIRPQDVAPFIIAQFFGAGLATALASWLGGEKTDIAQAS